MAPPTTSHPRLFTLRQRQPAELAPARAHSHHGRDAVGRGLGRFLAHITDGANGGPNRADTDVANGTGGASDLGCRRLSDPGNRRDRRLGDVAGSLDDPVAHPTPDGTRIAFTSDRDGDYDTYVMDADGGNVRQLTDDSGWDSQPAWSPVR